MIVCDEHGFMSHRTDSCPYCVKSHHQMNENETIEWVERHSQTLEDWLSMMRFGAARMELNPLLAIELICREAERKRVGVSNWCHADRVRDLIGRLGWSISFTTHPPQSG